MDQQKKCEVCGKKERCGEVYRRLGSSSAPSVTKTVIFAFVVPVLSFIIILVVASELLKPVFKSKTAASAAAFFIALAAVTILILLIRSAGLKLNINKRHKKSDENSCEKQ